jgi:hypothetical protein
MYNLRKTLAALVRKYLRMTANLVPSEWLFSETGLIINKQRSKLKEDLVNKIVFLNKK